MIDITKTYKENGDVEFQYYRDSSLWYKTECGVVFPVPIEDIGNSTFLNKDKARLFMRYMRKYNKSLEI